MNTTSITFLVIAILSGIASITACQFKDKAADSERKAEAPKEPDDNSYRIVKMSNGKYRVESYYRSSMWHAIGSSDNKDMSLELALQVYDSLTRKRDEPERVEVIK